MEKLQRNHKRAIIIFVYLIIFFLLGWMVYSWIKPAPTCEDGKKNQNETGIDCGGVCGACKETYQTQDLIVKEKSFVAFGTGMYDVMARISNPNNQLGSSDFSYEFILKDANGNVLVRRSGKSFILPVESKYIIETNLESKEVPASVDVLVGSPKWEEFFGYEKPELNIYSKQYNLISSGIGYSEAKGLLRNESSFDFEKIKVNVVLRDENGTPVAFNSTEMKTIKAGEERDFRLFWPINFPGSVKDAPEMEAEADVFDSQNFIKSYIRGNQNFQKN